MFPTRIVINLAGWKNLCLSRKFKRIYRTCNSLRVASSYPRRGRCFLQSNCSSGALLARDVEGKRRRIVTGEGRFIVITWHRYATARRRRFDRVSSSRARIHVQQRFIGIAQYSRDPQQRTMPPLSRWLLRWRLQHALPGLRDESFASPRIYKSLRRNNLDDCG